MNIKRIALALAFTTVFCTAAAGALTKPVKLTFAAQEEGTTAYSHAMALQEVMLKELPKDSEIYIATTSPGSVGAPVIVNNAVKCDIVMSNAAPAKWAREGTIKGLARTRNVACLAGGLGNDFINIMFTKKFVDKTGIKTIEQLVAKKYPVKLVIKKNGMFGELTAEKVFEALGVRLNDIVNWGGEVEKTSLEGIKTGLQEDLYDMTIDHIGAGQPNTSEICRTHAMYCVQMSPKTMEKLVEMGYNYTTIPANTWKGQTKEIKTVGSQQVILVSTTMSKDVAYALTKAVCENAEELAEMLPTMSYFKPAAAGKRAVTGVPLHEGAEKYYKEMGYATK